MKHIHETVVLVGSAYFATAFHSSCVTLIARLIKKLAKRQRVLLMDKYFTTQMCSGYNIHFLAERIHHVNYICHMSMLFLFVDIINCVVWNPELPRS